MAKTETQNGAVVLATAPVLDDIAASVIGNLPVATPEPTYNDETDLTVTIDGAQVRIVHNGRAVSADIKTFAVTGKATEWDAVLLAALRQKRGAELVVTTGVKLNATTGMARPDRKDGPIKQAILRLPAHLIGRVQVSRLPDGINETGTGPTYGAVLVRVKPAAR